MLALHGSELDLGKYSINFWDRFLNLRYIRQKFHQLDGLIRNVKHEKNISISLFHFNFRIGERQYKGLSQNSLHDPLIYFDVLVPDPDDDCGFGGL